jgi:hypothetical protein
MIWVESWESIPAGTYPANDDEMIAARIGMDYDDFNARRKALMRGWERHSDGLLYHPFITSQVLQMISGRGQTSERQRRFREANERRKAEAVTRHSDDVTRYKDEVTRESRVSNGEEQELEVKKEGTNVPLSEATASDRVSACPHLQIIDLYHDALPELPGIVASRWTGSKDATALQARWREDPRHQSLDFWTRFFAVVRTNAHWMGHNDRGWAANLRWLVKRENFDKVVERMVNVQGAANG